MADVHSRVSMGSVAHVGEGKKWLVNEVHKMARMDVRLVISVDSSMLVQNGSESLLIVSGKTDQYLDPSLVKLKRLVDESR